MFLKPEKLQNHSNEEKGKEEKQERGEGKEENEKKAIVAFLVFIITTLELVFSQKTLSDVKGPLGDNVFKNSAKHIRQTRENEPEPRIDFKGEEGDV